MLCPLSKKKIMTPSGASIILPRIAIHFLSYSFLFLSLDKNLFFLSFCWFILIGSSCLGKNASISGNFLYRNFHNRDTVFLEVSRRIFAEDLFQYGKR